MSQTLDVNVLVYASNADAPEHQRAGELLGHLAAGPALVVLFWPAVLGYLRIATHPGIFSSPLSHHQATGNIDAFLSRSHVRVVGETDGFWASYLRTTADGSIRAKLVADAHLVALMHDHGVRRIWTRDRDFSRFEGITARDPFSDRYRNGFTGRRSPDPRHP